MQARDADELNKLQASVRRSLEKFKDAYRKFDLLSLSSDDLNLSYVVIQRANRIINFPLAQDDTLAMITDAFLESVVAKSSKDLASGSPNNELKKLIRELLADITQSLEQAAKAAQSKSRLESASPQLQLINLSDLLDSSEAFAEFRCPMTLAIVPHNDAVRIKKANQFYTGSSIRSWVSQRGTDPLTRAQIEINDIVADSDGFRTKLIATMEVELKKLGMVEPQLSETIEKYKKDNDWPSPTPSRSAREFFSALPLVGALFRSSSVTSAPRERREPSPARQEQRERQEQRQQPLTFRGYIIGNPGVGKSCLILCLSGAQFTNDLIAFDSPKKIEIDNETVMELHDTANRNLERFQNVRNTPYRSSHIIFIAFDITNRQSFEDVVKWIYEVDRYSPEGVATVLVGTKADLKNERQISQEDIREFAEQNNLTYVELSAKTSENVPQLIDICKQGIVAKLRQDMPGPSSAPPRLY